MPGQEITQRVNSSDSHIASLTGLRGLAALTVVLVHVASRTDYPGLGIHAFGPIMLFVLSGFLLYRPFARWTLGVTEAPSLWSYSMRRGARIFPAFWVVLAVWMVVYPKAVPVDSVDWIKTVTLVSSLEYFGLTPGMEHTWTMGTELTWYVALPALALLVHNALGGSQRSASFGAHALLLFAAVPASVLWTMYARANELENGAMWLPSYLYCFALGALVSLVVEAERAGVVDFMRARLVLGDTWLLPVWALALGWLATSEWAGPDGLAQLSLGQQLMREGAACALAVVLLMACLSSAPQAPLVRLMSSRWMEAMGRWSYGIYLWHLPLIVLLWEQTTFPAGVGGVLVWLIVVLPVSTALGAATYAFVERPAIAWSHRQSIPVERATQTPPASAGEGLRPNEKVESLESGKHRAG